METLKTVLVFSTIVLALKTQAVEAKKWSENFDHNMDYGDKRNKKEYFL